MDVLLDQDHGVTLRLSHSPEHARGPVWPARSTTAPIPVLPTDFVRETGASKLPSELMDSDEGCRNGLGAGGFRGLREA